MVIDSIRKQSSLLAASKYIDAISGLIGIIVYTRIFNPESLGLYFVGLAISSICASASAGIMKGVEKRGSEKDSNLSSYYSLGLLLSFISTVIMSTLIIIGYEIVTSGILLVEYDVPFKIAVGSIVRLVPEVLYRLNNAVYQCKGKIALTGYLDTLRGITETIVQVLLIIYIEDVIMLFIGSALSTIIVGLAMYVLINETVFAGFTAKQMRNIVEYILWGSFNGVLKNSESNLVTILTGSIISATATATYGIARRTKSPTTNVPISISKSVFVDTSYKESEDKDNIKNLDLGLKYGAVIAIPVFIGSLVLSEETLLLLYSESYTDGSLVLIGLSFGAILQSESIIIKSYLDGRGRPDYVAKSSFIRIILSLGILIPSLYYFGIIGIVVSHIISRILRFGYLYSKIEKRDELKFGRSGVLLQLISSVIMMIFVLIIKEIIGSGAIETAFMIGLGGTIYAISLLIVDSDLREKIISVVRIYRNEG